MGPGTAKEWNDILIEISVLSSISDPNFPRIAEAIKSFIKKHTDAIISEKNLNPKLIDLNPDKRPFNSVDDLKGWAAKVERNLHLR
jgi:hypothetical protein